LEETAHIELEISCRFSREQSSQTENLTKSFKSFYLWALRRRYRVE